MLSTEVGQASLFRQPWVALKKGKKFRGNILPCMVILTLSISAGDEKRGKKVE